MHGGGMNLVLRLLGLFGTLLGVAVVLLFIGLAGARELGGTGVQMLSTGSKFIIHSLNAAMASH